MNCSTPWFKHSWLKSPGLKSSKFMVEKSRVEMSFNHYCSALFLQNWFQPTVFAPQTPTSACGSKGLQQRLRKWVASFSIGQFPFKVQPNSRAKTIHCRVQSFRFKYLTRSLIKQCLVCTRLAVFSFHGKAPKPTLMCFHRFLPGSNYHVLFFKSTKYIWKRLLYIW